MNILNKYIQQLPAFLGLAALLMLSACKKEKLDYTYDNRVITDARKSSSIRLVNLGGYNQVIVNGDTLTSFYYAPVVPVVPGAPVTEPVLPGTKYFPDNGYLGSTWNVPQSLLKDGKAHLLVESGGVNVLVNKLNIDLDEANGQGVDYYLQTVATPTVGLPVPKYVKVPRDVTAPSDPAKFKVRILNLGEIVGRTGMENLIGPLSLAWADGTLVSDKTNNIAPGQYSEYVELPYTTAQLKVLTQAGIQVPGVTSYQIRQETSTLTMERGWPLEDSRLTFSPFKSFVPGGIYTIVVAPYNFTVPYRNGNPGEQNNDYQSAIRIINDASEAVNITYARVQAVNTLPGQNDVKITMNGRALGNTLTYTAHTDYQSYVTGKYTIEAKNVAGNLLASTEFTFDPNTNFTLWLHPNADGKATISPVANDLSRVVPGITATDDATYVRNKLDVPFSIRFLNLCPDIPYVTFTKNDGQTFVHSYNNNPAAVNNLRPGIFPTEAPYIQMAYNEIAYKIMAYRSQPGVVPGSWAADVPVLTGQNLIARPALYVRGSLPNHEPGVYTIALVGSTNSSAPADQKAKMIVLKHTK